jgi:hypothetical protein
MIIFDYSQVAISNIIENMRVGDNFSDESLSRHMILNTLRANIKKFKSTYGPEIVIACDSRHSWRKTIFPPYKAHRKKDRKDSALDWTLLFKHLEMVKEELRAFSPYKIIEVETCEADDIIAVLAQKCSPSQKVLILSTDKDFIQLQRYKNVFQYSPIKKKYLKSDNPTKQLKELIIRGDKDDGVPNILSPDDVFISGGRQKSIYEAKLVNWLEQLPEEFCDIDTLKNYERNVNLIDLTKIPQDLVAKIVETYDNATVKTKMEFLNYMIQFRLKLLIECMGDF